MSATTDDLKKIACDAIDKSAGELEALSKELWTHPELAYNEKYAHQYITGFLEDCGFNVERHYAVFTGFRSVVKSGKGPNVAILCEYDALSDNGHSCGHNLICEVGIGASIGVKAVLDARKHAGKELGTLTVLGTPGEEGKGGKVDFVKQKAFEDVTCAMMAHPAPINSTTFPSLSREQVEVRYHGKASHASGAAWEGLNALDAAIMAYSGISCMRQQMNPSCRIHGKPEAQPYTLVQAKALAMTAVDIYCNPQAVKKALEEFNGEF